MYLLEFVNLVRRAQGQAPIERLPETGDDRICPLEVAMGCGLDGNLMRFASPEVAAAVAREADLATGIDRLTVAMPAALSFYASFLLAARTAAPVKPETARHALALV